jgi:hypothetical protein
MNDASQSYLGYYPDSNTIRLSDEFEDVLTQLNAPVPDSGSGPAAELRNKILAGNQIRKLTQNDALALVAAARIASLRAEVEKGDPKPRPLEAHVIATLKHPKEVESLRRVYGSGFFLIGIASSEDERQGYFRDREISAEAAAELIEIER